MWAGSWKRDAKERGEEALSCGKKFCCVFVMESVMCILSWTHWTPLSRTSDIKMRARYWHVEVSPTLLAFYWHAHFRSLTPASYWFDSCQYPTFDTVSSQCTALCNVRYIPWCVYTTSCCFYNLSTMNVYRLRVLLHYLLLKIFFSFHVFLLMCEIKNNERLPWGSLQKAVVRW